MADLIKSINSLSAFLSFEKLPSLSSLEPSPSRAIVLVGSAILPTAEAVFTALARSPGIASTLVICGGVGHSTQLLRDAISDHPTYCSLYATLEPNKYAESQLLQLVLEKFFVDALDSFHKAGGRVLIDAKSTNCGANAVETRRVLEENSIPTPTEMVVVQDPTMARRTVASFQKAYSDVEDPPMFVSCPTFVPVVRGPSEGMMQDASLLSFESLSFASRPQNPPASELWKMPRFIDLLLGEIPRLRDDENGYGPRGKGFITHVDVPKEIEMAWQQMNEKFGGVEDTGRGKMA